MSGEWDAPDNRRSDAEQRLSALDAASADLARAVREGDEEARAAALAAFLQADAQSTRQERLDTMRIPLDAGEHAEALRRMLGRVPERWGRSVRCARGWYPILVALDAKLVAIDPDYKLLQAKQKLGELRVYVEPSGDPNEPPGDPAPPRPLRAAGAEALAAWEEAMVPWRQRCAAWHATDVYRAAQAAYEARVSAMYAAVHEAMDVAARTCEACGAPGRLRSSEPVRGELRTLCDACAGDHPYPPNDHYWSTQ